MVNTAKNFLIIPNRCISNSNNSLQMQTISKRTIQNKIEATGDLIGKKGTDRITKVSNILLKNNSETATNEHNKEIPKERYISPQER